VRNGAAEWGGGGGGLRLFTRCQTRRAARVRADGTHKRLFIYALSGSGGGKGGFIYHARAAGVFKNRFGRASPRRRASICPSVNDGPAAVCGVFRQCSGPEDRKEIGN